MRSASWTGRNRARLLEGGEEFFTEFFEAILSSRREILIDTYIIENDRIGRELRDRLTDALRRGVRVSLYYDGFGCLNLPETFFKPLQDAGGEAVSYNPVRFFPRIRNLFSERLHRKVAVIDRRLAFVTGMNFSEEYLLSHPSRARMDHGVQIEGPIVDSIYETLFNFRHTKRSRIRSAFRKLFNTDSEDFHLLPSLRAAFVVRDNFAHRRALERHFLAGVREAKKEVWIAAAYFLPGARLIHALRNASKRGVKVRLILEGKAEFVWLKLATSSLYQRLLSAGIEIYEYEEKLLHSKLACVDDDLVSIGSCNLDPISLFLNLEANLVIHDRDFAQGVEQKLQNLINGSKLIGADNLQKLSHWQRAASRFFYLLLRLASDVVIGRS